MTAHSLLELSDYMVPRHLALRALSGGIIATAVAQPASAQPRHGALGGTLRSEDTHAPVPNAIIEIASLRLRTMSDSLGRYQLPGLAPGEVRVELRALGFHPVVAVVLIRIDTLSRLDLAMRPTPMPVVDVAERVTVLRGNERLRGFHDRRAAGFGRFLTREDIERRNVTDTKELLRGMPGVRLVGNRIQMASGMSAPRCMVQYFLDAVHIAGAPIDFLSQFRPRDIEGLEVYRGPAETPAEFSRGGASCGVIVIWSRTPGGRR